MAFMISNQVLATAQSGIIRKYPIHKPCIDILVLMDQITHACHSRLKNTDPKDTISLLQKHWNNAGQLTSQQSNTVVDAF